MSEVDSPERKLAELGSQLKQLWENAFLPEQSQELIVRMLVIVQENPALVQTMMDMFQKPEVSPESLANIREVEEDTEEVSDEVVQLARALEDSQVPLFHWLQEVVANDPDRGVDKGMARRIYRALSSAGMLRYQGNREYMISKALKAESLEDFGHIRNFGEASLIILKKALVIGFKQLENNI